MVQAENINQVLGFLDQIIEESKGEASRIGYFAALYRLVTAKVKAGIEAGDFEDGPRMAHLDVTFANRYLAALTTWRAGSRPSKCWEVAFEATKERDLMILTQLLLGMNAHINLDLGVAAAQIMPEGEITALKPDFMKINAILAAELGPVQNAINRLSPLFDLLDRVGGRTDEAIALFSIDAARDMAWHQAKVLSQLDAADRAVHIRQQDRMVAFLGEKLAHPRGILGATFHLIALSETQSVTAVIEALERA